MNSLGGRGSRAASIDRGFSSFRGSTGLLRLIVVVVNIVNFINEVRDFSGLYNNRHLTLRAWACMRTIFLSDGRIRRFLEMRRWPRSLASLRTT